MKLEKEEAEALAAFTQNELQVLGEMLAERLKQHAKWGEQNHRNVPAVALVPQALRIPTADEAKRTCQTNAKIGTVTWADIALEEFAEAVEEAGLAENAEDQFEKETRLQNLRVELIQTGAVFAAWAAAVDRQLNDLVVR